MRELGAWLCRSEGMMPKIAQAVEAIRQKIAPALSPEEDRTLRQAAQIVARVEDAPEGFHVTTLISDRTGGGLLDCTWLGQVAQLTPENARETAWMLMEAASVAETDAMLHRFARNRIGLQPEAVAAMIQDLRAWRKTEPGPGHVLAKDGQTVS
jgi:hypothetical protein